jgi:hypothetical protein
MRPVDIAKALKIGRASVYRVLGQPQATGQVGRAIHLIPRLGTHSASRFFAGDAASARIPVLLVMVPSSLSCSVSGVVGGRADANVGDRMCQIISYFGMKS